ncbi:MAG: hypothetical protein OEL89_03190 [Candidatus Peregrinibacteria bacterium]|nr:hypothetical protein [Candidatus Peregrinibacteria bacterium]
MLKEIIFFRITFNSPLPYNYSSDLIDMDWRPTVHDSHMWRAYGGARFQFSSSDIKYKLIFSHVPTDFYGIFKIHLQDWYSWPSKWSAYLSETYDAAKYLKEK